MATRQDSSPTYIVVGVLLIVAGVAWVLFGKVSGVTYTPVEGISVFAALYVIAQGAERVAEWIVDLLSLRGDSPEQKKRKALIELRIANSTLNGNPNIADFAVTAANSIE